MLSGESLEPHKRFPKKPLSGAGVSAVAKEIVYRVEVDSDIDRVRLEPLGFGGGHQTAPFGFPGAVSVRRPIHGC